MERAAKKRIPKFAYEYMTGGIGPEVCLGRNRAALNAITFLPRYLTDLAVPDCRKSLLGWDFDAPFGVAPVGLGGLIWPRAAEILAAAAKRHNVPFAVSTFATTSLERIAEIAEEHAWFQLYLPNDPAVEASLIERAKAAGYQVLVVTVDIPTETRREKDMANGLSVPPRFDLRTLLQIVARPTWALETLRAGIPVFETLQCYVPAGHDLDQASRFLTDLTEVHVSRDTLARLRDRWPGKLIVKGILDPEEARACRDLGADAVVVSNHGGRQLDAAPASVTQIPAIRQAVGDMPVLADGGARSGLDVLRMLAAGADFVLMGRTFMFAVAALGKSGGDHAMEVLKEELRATLGQLGCPDLAGLPEFLLDRESP